MRVYLGVAAGVGTTYAMLDEALRRQDRGTKVLVGCVHTHCRPVTKRLVGQLIGPLDAPEILDVDAVLVARPDVVLVDDLAYANPGNASRPHRWQDVEAILEAGIDVITTLTVQHIDSLSDPVREIVGRAPQDLVPDSFLGRADQIELVDISPEAIRRRIAHGNVFGPDELRPADADLFNSKAFAELRALLMYWMADRLSAGPGDTRGAREKVIVAVANSPTSDMVLRRAARLAQRSRAPLVGVFVTCGAADDDGNKAERKERVEHLGGTYHEISGIDVADSLVSFAAAEHATQLVLGTAPTSWWTRRWRPTVVDEVIRLASTVDVHVVSVEDSADRGRVGPLKVKGDVPIRRQLLAVGAGTALLTVLTGALAANRGGLSVATSLALYLLAVVTITAVGGRWPGLAAAVAAPLLANWFLIPPYHTFRINNGENLLELVVFVSVAAIVSAFVTIAARRAAEAQRAQREAATLASLTGSGDLELPEVIVEQLQRAFRLDGVAVFAGDGPDPEVMAAWGDAPIRPADADIVAPLATGLVVAAKGPALGADDHRILHVFLAQLSRAFEQQQLRLAASEADALGRADELRTAILRAVSHDLRSPLAGIKASVSSLRQRDVEWPDDIRDEFLASIESDTDRLTSIVTNLLDLSRLEAGVLRPVLRAVLLEEVVPAALSGLGRNAIRVVVEIPADLAEVNTDPALLERVLANLVANALHWSPDEERVTVRAHRSGPEVQVHVIDHGPGIPRAKREVVVQPFHRLGDSGPNTGLGLGLAIADRLVAAMAGSLELRDTPGGGLTAVVSLPTADTKDAQ